MMIRRLYQLWPHPGLLIRLGILQAVTAILQGLLLGILVPVLRALMQPIPDFAAAVPWLITGSIGLLCYGVLTIIATPVGFAASMELAAQLRHHLMQEITTLPLGWFTTERKAKLSRSITADTGNIAHLAVTIGAPAITAVLVPATIIAITFFVDWHMALLFLVITPLAYLTLRHAGNVAAAADEELEEANAEIAGRAIEFGQAQTVLRAAGQGATGGRQMREALEEHHRSYKRGLGKATLPDMSYVAVVAAGFVAVLILGTTLVIKGTLTIPEGIAVLVLAARFLEPMGSLIELIGALRAMDNAINRVQSILHTERLPQSPGPVRHWDNAIIRFADVSFSYNDKLVLSGVSFCCRPGTTTALVGPSGSGKTTIIRLIARFFDVNGGCIQIGGHNIKDLDYAMLMDDIAIIFQEVYLFDTTIEENVRLAKPDATAEELVSAATEARLSEVIDRLPMGWQTRVGEGGMQLSGGERQRVSIARAFLKKARIVLIDEASSALDPENEHAVGQAIANLSRDPQRTVIIIAHRPATLVAASQVISLDNGRVAESGDPELLKQNNGLFSRLYTQYEQARSWHIGATTGPDQQPS